MYGTDHTEIMIGSGEYLDLIPELIRYKDAPLAVANEVPLHLMSRELKKEITVVLSGEGADELFAGYGRIFRSPFDYERARFLENDSTILPEYRLLNQGMVEWSGLPLISLSQTPMTGAEMRLKALLDRLGSGLFVLLLSPLFIILAMLVRLSGPGPVLFRQKRNGIGGESIDVLKFRTMKQHETAKGEVVQATEHDPRVTGIGRFLRRTSLDELPQLFNVLRG